jgi:nucleotide-binding universal stress UspA family protein
MGELRRERYRVVIGVDFTEESKHAIEEAVHMAKLMPSADLHFVHVLEAPEDLHNAYVIDRLSERMGRTMIELETHVRDALFILGGQGSWGCDVAYHVRVGPPAREIHQVAVDVDAALIIVGTGRGGMFRFLHGRSTRELVKSAHVPVVVAHEKNFRGMSRSPVPDPPRPGQDLHAKSLSSYSYVNFSSQRDSHVSGLI